MVYVQQQSIHDSFDMRRDAVDYQRKLINDFTVCISNEDGNDTDLHVFIRMKPD
jgi:hypothetical protein